jgi:hypothetical protein
VFSSRLCVQTSSEAHVPSYPVGTGSPLSGAKVLETDHYLVLRSRIIRNGIAGQF